MFCKFCGKPIDPNSRFCVFCGKPLLTSDDNSTGQSNQSNNSSSDLLKGLKKNQISFAFQDKKRTEDDVVKNANLKKSSNDLKIDNKATNDSNANGKLLIDGEPLESIEKLIGTSQFTQDMFDKHTKIKCWGCGKVHVRPYVPYLYSVKKTRSEKKGAVRHTTEYSKSAYVSLCPDCYKRITKYDLQEAKKRDKTLYVDGAILALSFIALFIYFSTSSNDGVMNSFFAALIATIMVGTLGQFILLPIAYLITGLFVKIDVDNKTRWSFNDIPVIRRFNKYM